MSNFAKSVKIAETLAYFQEGGLYTTATMKKQNPSISDVIKWNKQVSQEYRR